MFTILLVHLAGLASPGPDFFYIVRQSASHSIKAGILAAIGISLGIVFWAGFAIFGLAWINHTLGNVVQYAIMLLGGAYLCYIGQQLLRIKNNIHFANNPQDIRALNPISEIRKGLMINIFNAKAGVYFTSVVSAFLGQFTQTSQLWALLCLFVISTFVYFCLVALCFSRRPVRQIYTKYSRYIDHLTGFIFVLFGLLLIYEGVQHL